MKPGPARPGPATQVGRGARPMHGRRGLRRGSALLLAAAPAYLAGCAIVVPDPTPPAPAVSRWQAPVPQPGVAADIARWWERLEDPVLPGLIEATQRDNPTLAGGLARLEQARAVARASGAALLPTLDGGARATRSFSQAPPPLVSTVSGVTLDALWELDLFGANRRTREASVARVGARQAEWHDARTSLAAEVASNYANLRLCESLLQLYREDMASQGRTLELTFRKVRAGLAAPADAALITASAAESSNRMRGQRAQCDLLVKTLVALTGLSEPLLRERLATRPAALPQPLVLTVDAVPAQVLARRPDLVAIERELAAASLDVGIAQADRYPRIRFAGSIGLGAFHAAGETVDGAIWSFGPSLSVPLFDAGRRQAIAERFDARFAEVAALYSSQARAAIREVEQALVRIDSATERLADAERASESFQVYLKATQTRYETGAGSLFEQEDARRSALNAAGALLQIRGERLAAWITLYKALGGGWEPDEGTR